MARVCVDSTYFNVNDDGQLTIKPGSVGYQTTIGVLNLVPLNFQIADYPGAKWLYVEAVGGGGGGAGAQDTSGTSGIAQGGGSGGTYCASWLDAATLPAIVPVIGGNGGSGGVFNAAGADGTASSFGTLVVAPGGIGADDIMLTGATTGVGKGAPSPGLGTGQVRLQGQPGGTALMITAFYKTGGFGGASGWPGAGGQGAANNEGGGAGQVYYGGGGGGAAAFNGGWAGGTGGAGQVRISVYR